MAYIQYVNKNMRLDYVKEHYNFRVKPMKICFLFLLHVRQCDRLLPVRSHHPALFLYFFANFLHSQQMAKMSQGVLNQFICWKRPWLGVDPSILADREAFILSIQAENGNYTQVCILQIYTQITICVAFSQILLTTDDSMATSISKKVSVFCSLARTWQICQKT